jgi:predicted nucleic acid-binding protein
MFLLDTCVVSEATKVRKDAAVERWLTETPIDEQFISALTIGELHFGAAKLPVGKKRRSFEGWVAEVEHEFTGKIVPLDENVAAVWGKLKATDDNSQSVDMQIAATAITYGFVFVTRNVKHFRFDGLKVVNPWEM